MDDISAWNCNFSRRHQQDGAKSTKALAPRFLQSWWECLTRTTAAETNCSEQAPQLTLSCQDKVRYVKFPATAGKRCEDSKLENWWEQIPRDTRIYPDIPFWGWYINGISRYILVYLEPGCPDIPRYTQIYRWYTTPKTVYLGISRHLFVSLAMSLLQFAKVTSLSSICRLLLQLLCRNAACFLFVCAVQFRV